MEIDLNIEIHAGVAAGREFLFEKADFAVREAQKRHVDVVVYSAETTHVEQKRNIEMLKKVKLAIQTDRIVPYYQPIVNARGHVVKYEALVRVLDIDGSVITPGAFLEILKSSKLYGALTRIVLQKSLTRFADLAAGVSVNLSIIDILNPETMAMVREGLAAFPDPSRVTFELLESESMEGYDEVNDFIAMVRELGAKIAIDDFGTGYSNFSYLATIRPDYLKIDGSLIQRLPDDRNAEQIVRSIVEFSHALGMTVIAEFVSDGDIFEAARHLGIDHFQGYFFGKPTPDPGARG
jgi:EAL domain-containing protein (putative c-di-GMP-specific phosphodiesterase class I)